MKYVLICALSTVSLALILAGYLQAGASGLLAMLLGWLGGSLASYLLTDAVTSRPLRIICFVLPTPISVVLVFTLPPLPANEGERGPLFLLLLMLLAIPLTTQRKVWRRLGVRVHESHE